MPSVTDQLLIMYGILLRQLFLLTISASEVTILWCYTNLFIISIVWFCLVKIDITDNLQRCKRARVRLLQSNHGARFQFPIISSQCRHPELTTERDQAQLFQGTINAIF